MSNIFSFSKSGFAKYFKNTSWVISEKLIKIIITLFINVLVIRYLGPERFGILSYAISFVSIFATLAGLGLDKFIVQEILSDENDVPSVLGTSFYLKFFSSITSILLLTVLSFFILDEDSNTIILIVVISLTLLLQSTNVIDYYYQAYVKSKRVVIIQVTSLIITSIVKVLLVVLEFELLYFAIAVTLEWIIISVGFLILIKKEGYIFTKWDFDLLLAKKLLKVSWPLILSGLAISIYMKIDQIMLKNMLNKEQVGFYASAVRLCEAWYFVPTVLANSLFPAIIKARENKYLYLDRLQKLYDLLLFISLVIAIPTTFLAPIIIKLLYGTAFLPAAEVLTVYIWAGIASFLGVATSQFLIIEKLTKLAFYRTFLGMIINIILNIILIPKLGIVGSAYATLISYFSILFILFFFKSTRKQFIMVLKAIFMISLTRYIYQMYKRRI